MIGPETPPSRRTSAGGERPSGYSPEERLPSPLHTHHFLSTLPPNTQEAGYEEVAKHPVAVISYISGVHEDIGCVCRKFGVRVGFRSRQTLHAMLTRVKDTLPLEKRRNVVYQISCGCGKVYIGETRWRLETRVKERWDACNNEAVERSEIAEHVWDNQHSIDWKEKRVTD